MQRLSKLYARLISLCHVARVRKSWQDSKTETSASPILVFVAVALLLILAILEIDLHSNELRAIGLISSEKGADPVFVGP